MAIAIQHDEVATEVGAAEQQSVASYLGEKAEQATGAFGAGMESLGCAVRQHSPKGLAAPAETIADKLESGGRYLEEKGLHGIGADLTQLVRENPLPALLIGVGLGLALARIFRSPS